MEQRSCDVGVADVEPCVSLQHDGNPQNPVLMPGRRGEPMKPVDTHKGRLRSMADPAPGRLGRSAACRNWYRWRRIKENRPVPLWVTLSPPWPIVRLACRMKGTSPILTACLTPFTLLACMDDDRTDPFPIDQEPRVKFRTRSARLLRNIGVGASRA